MWLDGSTINNLHYLSFLYLIITIFFFSFWKYVWLLPFFHVTYILFCKSLLFTIIFFSLLIYVSLIYFFFFFADLRSKKSIQRRGKRIWNFRRMISSTQNWRFQLPPVTGSLSPQPLPPSRLCLFVASFSSPPLPRRHCCKGLMGNNGQF